MKEPGCFLPRRFERPEDVIPLLQAFLTGRAQECLVVIHLSESFEHLQFTCFKGDLDSVTVAPKTILAAAIDLGTKSLILAHNHLSGDERASPDDLKYTKRLAELCAQLDVYILDHLIFGEVSWTSLRGEGYL